VLACDAIAMIGFNESKKILIRMSEVRVGPGQKLVYGTAPETKLSSAFTKRLKTDDPNWSTPTTPVRPTMPS
jgi:hypothetical protein